MKHKLLSIIALGILFIGGSAFAGKGGPIITGAWTGTGQAMYVDGTSAEITEVNADLLQEGNFFYGVASFEVIFGDSPDPHTQVGQMSGYISGNTVKGVMGGCIAPPPEGCLGGGILEGKLSGNKLSGTVVDLSDGSTSVVVLHRMSR